MDDLAQLDQVQDLTWEHVPACSFLCGVAGTGKSTLVRQRVEADERYGVIGASTGIAAVNIGATTINSLLGYFDTLSMRDAFLQGHLTRKLHMYAKKHRRIIVEECSMFPGEQLDLLYRTVQEVNRYRDIKEPMGILCVGDFAQLAPINASWAFESAYWPEFAAHTERLDHIWRQDDAEFISALNRARAGDGASAADMLAGLGVRWHTQRDLDFDGTTIVPKNEMVSRHNQMILDHMRGPVTIIVNKRWGQQRSEWGQNVRTKEWGIPPALQLKIGAYVMCLANAQGLRYANGDCGHVQSIDTAERSVEVKLVRTGKTETVYPVLRDVVSMEHAPADLPWVAKEERRYFPTPHKCDEKYVVGQCEYVPLRAAWASTVHKSQGLTLDRCQIDFRDKFFSSAAMLYVSLSRTRTFAGLRLVGQKDQFVKACNAEPKVKEYL